MNRLRSYRWIEDITQKQLGALLGISSQQVSAIESGIRTPTCDITRLGYTRFDVPHMSEPLHRQRARTRVASRRRAKELLRLAGETYIGLRQIHNQPKVMFERLQPPRDDDDIIECVKDVRTIALQHTLDEPIRNLTRAVEQAGICLIPIVGLEGIDGISSWVEDQPVIGLDINVPGDRFRLSLAHELGHLAMHKRNDNSEDEAYRFASALLLPDEDFEEAMHSRQTITTFINLKQSWGLSVAALVYRAHRFNYLDDRSYQSMQVRMSRWRRKEPYAMRVVHGQRFSWLVKNTGGVNNCAKTLGINGTHLRDIVMWRPLRAI